jgi:ACS family tartrate transporter-like MFS transporter
MTPARDDSRRADVTTIAADDELGQRAISAVTWRLIPFLLLLYIVAWLDRVNVGFAALQMNDALGFSAAVYGFGAGVFFVGYALCEVPSNLILARVGARRWIARIMVTWGALAVAMMFVRTASSFYVLRFLLGVAEAGFLPGIIYYLSHWFPAEQRARAVSMFMIGIPLAIVVGGPVAGLLLDMDGLLGLAGWQWLFLLEGAPALVLGVVVWLFLPDGPRDARWLTDAQRGWLASRIDAEQTAAAARHSVGLKQTLLHPTVWRLALIMFACQTGSYGLSLWVPQIIKGLSGLDNFEVGLVSALPYLAAAIGMVVIGVSSDRTGERFFHIAVPSLVAAIGFTASAYLTSPVPAMIALTIAAIGDLGSRGPFWALPGRFLARDASAAGIALINTVGSIGGFVGPYAVGLVKDATGGYGGGLLMLAALLVVGGFATLTLRASPVLAEHRGGAAGPLASRPTP